MQSTFRTMADVRAANRAAGNYFFERAIMRFFRSRVVTSLLKGGFFVTAEKSGWDDSSPRRYTVRRAMPDGDIITVGKFNGYLTLADAKIAVRLAQCAAQKESVPQ